MRPPRRTIDHTGGVAAGHRSRPPAPLMWAGGAGARTGRTDLHTGPGDDPEDRENPRHSAPEIRKKTAKTSKGRVRNGHLKGGGGAASAAKQMKAMCRPGRYMPPPVVV